MKLLVTHTLAALYLLLSFYAAADCVEGADRVRGEYQLELPPFSSVLLRIEQVEEALSIVLSEQNSNRTLSHPGGAGIDHWVLLETADAARQINLCLVAQYANAQAGSVSISEVSLAEFSQAEIAMLREMTQAAEYWGEGAVAARERALDIYKRVAITTANNSNAFVASATLFEGIALLQASQYRPALELFDALVTHTSNDVVLRYKALWKYGVASLRLRQLDAAISSFEQAIDLIDSQLQGSAGPARREFAELRLTLAQAYLAQGRMSEASAQIEIATATAESEYRLLGLVYDVLGYLEIVKSQQPGLTQAQQRESLSAAIDIMLAGRYFSESALDFVTQAAFENNLGFVYDRLGEFPRAFAHYRQVLNMVSEQEDPLVYRATYANLGRLYQYTADYPRSESYFRQAIALGEKSSGALSLARCPLGTTLRLNDEVYAARQEHLLCLQQAELVDSQAYIALARYELSEDALALGEEGEAWRYIVAAWEQANDGVPLATQVRIQRLYAWFLQQRGESDAANAVMSNLLVEQGTNNLAPVDIIDNHAMAMQLALQQGDYILGEAQGLRAIELIEQQYEQLESARLGASWSARTHAVYVQLAQAYLQEYLGSGSVAALDKAFNLTERSRAISLRQQFASAIADPSFAAGLNSNTAAEQMQIAVISEIANTHAQVSANSQSSIRLPASYYQHQDVLSLYRLQGVRNIPVPKAMTREQIQARLKPHQAALYYLMAEDDSYLFTLTANHLSVHPIADGEETHRLVAQARAALASPNDSPYELLLQLSEKLLVNIAALADIQELLIVPHGTLHSLPFSALPFPDSRQYQPLVSRYSVQMLPSLSTWLMEKNVNAAASATDVAIFADPVFDRDHARQVLAALDHKLDDNLRSWTDSLQRLQNTAVEAQNITALFPQERTVLLTGEAASRANLAREDVRSAKVLHIATHGYFNAASDDNVGLGFSVIDENGQPDSGFVTLPELFSYDFNNELVLISGCDTAMGRPLAGEGMMGISRGFVSQGVKHVISTLWPVSDRASAEFMAIFYQQLLARGNVAEALQASRNEIRQNPSYRSPFYWAAYVLTSVSSDQHLAFSHSPLSNISH